MGAIRQNIYLRFPHDNGSGRKAILIQKEIVQNLSMEEDSLPYIIKSRASTFEKLSSGYSYKRMDR